MRTRIFPRAAAIAALASSAALAACEVAHFIAENYAVDYQAIFGELPDLGGLPARAEPGMTAWESLSAARKDEVQRVFANMGKSLEAYERRLTCADTRFDRWMRGEITLSTAETGGAGAFVRDGCAGYHNGPSSSTGRKGVLSV